MKRTTLSLALLLLCSPLFAQSFHATLVGENVIRGGEIISEETALAIATFELTVDPANASATQLSYELVMPEFDLDGTRTSDLGDDVTAIHLHTLTECVAATCILGDTAGTKHVLNMYGSPRQDDADLAIDVVNSTITGIWDPSDVNSLTPAPGLDPNDFLGELEAGELFLMVHTRDFPSGAVGGFLVPEPTGMHLFVVCFALAIRSRRKTSS